jgi:predicted Fe-Mo cluster-binding NifX family protein
VKRRSAPLIFLSLLIIGGFFILPGQEEPPKKIAVASEGDTVDSQVGNQAGRSSWFLFFDGEGELLEAIENPFKQEGGGAGVSCAGLLAEKRVTVLVAGKVGNKMRAALDSSRIAFILFSGTVENALAKALETSSGKH